MKKMVSVVIVILLVMSVAVAEAPDFSAYTFDQLLELQKSISKEIMSRPEWKEVTVPSGTWIVGEDIPDGFYSISPTNIGGYITIMDGGSLVISQGIRKQEQAFGKIELKKGYIVEIENGSLIFAPPKGLGF